MQQSNTLLAMPSTTGLSMAVERTIPMDTSKMSKEQLQAYVTELESRPQSALRFKVGDKGGVSVYGLGRFPVTLYVEQWERLLSGVDALRRFIADNAGSLKRKDAAAAAAAAKS